ncbi:6-carboxy-5,6,7,8-tetrahydropterin synthase [Rubrobacter xylanophilus]|uniref:6-carboxy-5,6,7,8-tetrahydropterin synthase n=1 Tax=Rubrobacter xylanophilus TaxID=49319 RepID=A0A510HIV8_9ACTN|nr:6-carboxytetrahydropterin synthase [Rubrobacter xylanophilus]BBL79909.1 6-carboxy-5,6,7,8-tetrahydropterin synthase [Rubrobacter xylanophilus]
MYEVCVATSFEAAHRLVGDFGPASRLHGHTYRLEVVVRGERLREDGTLYDIGALQEAVDGIAASLHYRNLDEVPGLSGANTTAEVVASHCWESLAPGLRGRGLSSLTVRIWENPDVYAACEGALE